MAHLFMATLANLLILLLPFYAPAQVAFYTKANAENAENYESEAGFSASANAFHLFEKKFKVAAKRLLKNYPAIGNFSYAENAGLTHVFFQQQGNRMHVAFNHKGRVALEVQQLSVINYPSHIIQQVNVSHPSCKIMVVKQISTLYDNWHEVLINKNGEMVKVNIAGA